MSSKTWPIVAAGVAAAGAVAIVSILVVKNDEEEQTKARAEEKAQSLAAEMEREHQRKLAEEKAQLAQEAALAAAETMRQAVEEEKERQKAREAALEKARTQGVLGSLALQQGGAFASLTGTGDISSGFDDAEVFGGLLGNEPGELAGGFGWGGSGSGPGGDGGSGTIGLGNYGTLGHGSGTGQGYGTGTGRGGLRGRATPAPTVRLSVTQVNGGLDKAIVTRILRRSLGRVTYCYEKQLLVEPGLSGRLTLGFEIAEDGVIASPHATGVNDEVASCVETALASVRFPRPSSGTVSATASISMAPAP
jgi:hypothetical protein